MNKIKPADSTSRIEPVTIIGGGIAGLTAAIALKNIGIQATVFESAPEFKTVGAGITLADNAMKAFRILGLDQELMSAGNPIQSLEICDEKGKSIQSQKSEENDDDKTGIVAIHRADLHRILLSKLNRVQLINGKRLSSLVKKSDGVELMFEDGSVHRTRCLIGADGIHSQVRKAMLPESKLRYAGYTCWRGLTRVEQKIEKATETWGPAGRFGIVPLSGSDVYWFACKRAAAGDPVMEKMQPADIAKVFRDYHLPIEELILATRADQVIWGDIYDLKPIGRFAFENVVLMGDAAHATTPNLGQGACQAIEDAVILSGCMNKTSSAEEAFLLFEEKRIRRTHRIVKQSWQTGKIAQLENRQLIPIRNALLRAVPQYVMEKQLDRLYDVDLSV